MNGFLNILKPPGMTSAAVVAMVRRATGEKRVGHAGTLDPEALVSMNMWGFRSDIFEGMARDFDEFLRGIPEGEIKAEYALPTMVDKMINRGSLCVRALDTNAVWFGVTYREDRDYVAAELAKLHAVGAYPEKLK